MPFIRFGLFFFLILRLALLFPQLRQRFKGHTANVELNGVRTSFRYRVIRNSKSRRVRGVQVALDLPDRFRFRIKRETAFDRFAKAVGVAHEWQTNDRRFDDKAYILSDDAVLLGALSGNEALRNLVSDLLTEPFNLVLRCAYGTLWVETDYSAEHDMPNEEIGRELARTVLRKLMRVREELQTVSSGLWDAARDPGIRRQNFLLALSVVLGIAGIAAFFWPERLDMPRQLVDQAISLRATWLSAIALLVMFAGASVFLGTRSRLHWVLLELLLLGGPAVWLIANAESQWQNQHYDVATPQVREVRINRKYFETGRRQSKRYYFEMAGWPDPRVDLKLQVPFSLYAAFTPLSCAHVEWHEGSLGDPWISSFTPSECGDLER